MFSWVIGAELRGAAAGAEGSSASGPPPFHQTQSGGVLGSVADMQAGGSQQLGNSNRRTRTVARPIRFAVRCPKLTQSLSISDEKSMSGTDI
eukprot:843231-Rhodomonas_salina.4